jgi:putative redox protein
MSDVTVKVNWQGGLRFTGVNAGGIETSIDGDKQTAPTPVELLLEALGACTAVDVVIILEKQKTPAARLEVTLDGDRHSPEPRYYTAVRLRFDVWADGVKPEKLERAIDLSISKYCSVYHSLRKDMSLQVEYRLHPAGADGAGDYRQLTPAR